MVYTDIVSLEDAKIYLRVDTGFTKDDAQITRMISSACKFVENRTQIFLIEQNQTHYFRNGCVNVYSFPIKSVVDEPTTGFDTEVKALYTKYTTTDVDLKSIVTVVGYSDTTAPLIAEIPKDLIEVIYELIGMMYYEHKTGDKAKLSMLSDAILNERSRFFV